jgi:hypothetical protein
MHQNMKFEMIHSFQNKKAMAPMKTQNISNMARNLNASETGRAKQRL